MRRMVRTYLRLRRKMTKVMLPCVIEFQRENAYLSSSGSPMNDKRTLGGERDPIQ